MLGAVGVLLAKTGVLDPHGRKTLSKLIYFVFTPCLTFAKLAPVLTARTFVLWMPLAINMFFSVAVGMLLGVLLVLLVRPPAGFSKHVIVTTGLGNAGNLPLVLVAALMRSSGSTLFAGQDVSVDLAIAYVAVGIFAATVTHFTIGTQLLKAPGSKAAGQHAGGAAAGSAVAGKTQEELPLMIELPPASCSGGLQQHKQASAISSDHLLAARAPSAAVVVDVLAGEQQQQQQKQQQWQPSPLETGHTALAVDARPGAAVQEAMQQHRSCVAHLQSQQQQQQQQQQQHAGPDRPAGERELLLGPGISSSDSACWVQLALREKQPLTLQDPQHSQRSSSWWPHANPSSSSSKLGRLSAAGTAAGGFVWSLTSPPLVGCMLAVGVGMLPLLRHQLFSPGGHLLLVQDCIAMFGDCCIPSLMLMLGATLAKGPGRCCPPLRVVLGVTAARLLLLPLLGTGWLLLASKAGWLLAPDSVFLLVMLIQNSVPTALNVHTLATLNSNREEEVGALLFWQYLASCVTTPAWLMFYTWLLKSGAFAVAA
uniref:Uncharacterized protein n=1 Tax=Tetradesmus obliquus TaxID=3088 RepID=A0A383VGS0_TETOB|eukprot:jgi/Sobl393_1/5475/SZX64401.1